mmetsp:Transcript_19065/g.54589  ORF Transcript_19065/g.54589 Transcript_19065/m.54589 type:complete len:223 (+) Transcript_19065:196-864(+)
MAWLGPGADSAARSGRRCSRARCSCARTPTASARRCGSRSGTGSACARTSARSSRLRSTSLAMARAPSSTPHSISRCSAAPFSQPWTTSGQPKAPKNSSSTSWLDSATRSEAPRCSTRRTCVQLHLARSASSSQSSSSLDQVPCARTRLRKRPLSAGVHSRRVRKPSTTTLGRAHINTGSPSNCVSLWIRPWSQMQTAGYSSNAILSKKLRCTWRRLRSLRE